MTAHSKPEDTCTEVPNAMAICMSCDNCQKILYFKDDDSLEKATLECQHLFCKSCVVNVNQEFHTLDLCPLVKPKCRIVEFHDKNTSNSSEDDKKESKLITFEYEKRPVVVRITKGETYGQLTDKLHKILGVDEKKHELKIGMPRGYSGKNRKFYEKAEHSLLSGNFERDQDLWVLAYPTGLLSITFTEL